MAREPSAQLIELVERLHLADARQVRSVASRVRRLAGDLPDCDSLWVDALAQARVLTPYVAAQINAGRGSALCHGPYVIRAPLFGPYYAECYTAQHVETARLARLYVVRRPQSTSADIDESLTRLVDTLSPLAAQAAVAVDAGVTENGVWAACPLVVGTTAAQWMVEHGRFPPNAVAAIALDMIATLETLHGHGVVHGDIGAAGLIIGRSGEISLPMPGLRAVVRPREGYAFGDLQPEAYDGLCLSGSRPDRRRVSPATCTPVARCGGIFWPVGQHLPAATPWPG